MKKTAMLFIVLLAATVFASGCIGNKADTTSRNTELGLEDATQENVNDNGAINESTIKMPELIDDENVDLGSLL